MAPVGKLANFVHISQLAYAAAIVRSLTRTTDRFLFVDHQLKLPAHAYSGSGNHFVIANSEGSEDQGLILDLGRPRCAAEFLATIGQDGPVNVAFLTCDAGMVHWNLPKLAPGSLVSSFVGPRQLLFKTSYLDLAAGLIQTAHKPYLASLPEHAWVSASNFELSFVAPNNTQRLQIDGSDVRPADNPVARMLAFRLEVHKFRDRLLKEGVGSPFLPSAHPKSAMISRSDYAKFWHLALVNALQRDDDSFLSEFVDKHPDTFAEYLRKDRQGQLMELFLAAASAETTASFVQLLRLCPKGVRQLDDYKDPLLVTLVVYGRKAAVGAMLCRGADISVPNDAGMTAIDIAILRQDRELVKRLLPGIGFSPPDSQPSKTSGQGIFAAHSLPK